MQNITISILRSNVIRGLAILSVMILHILPYMKGIYHGNHQIFYVFLDQFSRFCVPVFLMLSGYGLAYKFDTKNVGFVSFLSSRLAKIIPLYLFWSFATIIMIGSVSEWNFGGLKAPLATQLFLGQVDYHLYFVPVLVQLYLLFPLIWKFKSRPNLMLFLAFFIQIGLYLFYEFNLSHTDRYEYVLSLSWLGYFVLGIYLKIVKISRKILLLAPLLAFAFLIYTVVVDIQKINSGIDPLPVLKFTKVIFLPYIVFFLLFLSGTKSFKIKQKDSFLAKIFSSLIKLLAWLGKNSYLIFLSHTVFFRIVYSFFYLSIDSFTLVRVSIYWLISLAMSYFLISDRFLRIFRIK